MLAQGPPLLRVPHQHVLVGKQPLDHPRVAIDQQLKVTPAGNTVREGHHGRCAGPRRIGLRGWMREAPRVLPYGAGAEHPEAGAGVWSTAKGRDALERGGGTPPPSRASSLCPATVPLTAGTAFNGICNRQ